MTRSMLVAMRLYTSHSFPAINNPLRAPAVLKWVKVSADKVSDGNELQNPSLAESLTGKLSHGAKCEFTKEEWEAFNIKHLGRDDFIESGGNYFKPLCTHPLPATVMCISDGLKNMRALHPEKAT